MTAQFFRFFLAFFVLSSMGRTDGDSVVTQVKGSKTVWGLKDGDSFTASVVIVKHTEVVVGNQEPTVLETTDKFLIQYRVGRTSPAGDVFIGATLLSPVRETGHSSPDELKAAGGELKPLEGLTQILEINPQGVVTSTWPSARDAIIARLSKLDPTASKLLLEACPDNVLSTWFARPFWVAHDPATLKAGSAWDRTDEIVFGAFGTLRCDAELRMSAAKEATGSIDITGKGRFLPLVVPSTESPSRTRFLTDVTAELDEYSGTGRMSLAPVTDDAPPGVPTRPQFGSLEVRIRFHGAGRLPGRKGDAATPEQGRSVSFQQTQTQSWTLQEFAFGRSEFLPIRPVPVPEEN